jgi:hypothetical protein
MAGTPPVQGSGSPGMAESSASQAGITRASSSVRLDQMGPGRAAMAPVGPQGTVFAPITAQSHSEPSRTLAPQEPGRPAGHVNNPLNKPATTPIDEEKAAFENQCITEAMEQPGTRLVATATVFLDHCEKTTGLLAHRAFQTWLARGNKKNALLARRDRPVLLERTQTMAYASESARLGPDGQPLTAAHRDIVLALLLHPLFHDPHGGMLAHLAGIHAGVQDPESFAHWIEACFRLHTSDGLELEGYVHRMVQVLRTTPPGPNTTRALELLLFVVAKQNNEAVSEVLVKASVELLAHADPNDLHASWVLERMPRSPFRSAASRDLLIKLVDHIAQSAVIPAIHPYLYPMPHVWTELSVPDADAVRERAHESARACTGPQERRVALVHVEFTALFCMASAPLTFAAGSIALRESLWSLEPELAVTRSPTLQLLSDVSDRVQRLGEVVKQMNHLVLWEAYEEWEKGMVGLGERLLPN